MAKKKTENIKAAPVLRVQGGGGGEQPTPTPEQTGTRTYQIMDPWKDRDVINLVDVKAVDGEITEVKVNGEPAGGGGGGIPETATVTFTNNNRVSTAVRYVRVNPNTGELSADQTNTISQGNSQTINRILVGSMLYSSVAGTNSTSTTGDITTTDRQNFHINGDGTITLR